MPDRDDVLTLNALRSRRDEILRIAKLRGARNVRVFGSVARGNAGVNSNVDFLVEMEPGRSVLDLSELILDLEEALGRHVDVVEIRHQSQLTEHILSGAVGL